jgi:hypothetical protein
VFVRSSTLLFDVCGESGIKVGLCQQRLCDVCSLMMKEMCVTILQDTYIHWWVVSTVSSRSSVSASLAPQDISPRYESMLRCAGESENCLSWLEEHSSDLSKRDGTRPD